MAQEKAEVEAEFLAALRRAGLRPKGAPIMDGKKHRVPVEGDRAGRLSGTYIGHYDEHPAGYIHNFKTGEEVRWRASGPYPALSAAARRQRTDRIAAEQRAREAERRHREAAVARKAEHIWTRAREVAAHPYLTRKGTASYGLRQDRSGDLLVPMRDIEGRLWGCSGSARMGRSGF